MQKTYQISDIEILIATMNRTNFDFLKKMFVNVNFSDFYILIVNQTTENELLISDFQNIRIINSFEKGLTKSRNLALSNTSKKLLVFTDDDVVFQQNFQHKIIEVFNKYINHDGFRFQYLNSENKLSKKYPKGFQSTLSQFETLNASSVELVFKTESLINAKMRFDENFGLGANFFMGEEPIFISDGIKKGLKFGFVPEIILTHSQPSTGHKTAVSEIYFIQSAVFYRIYGKIYLFWIALKLFFDIKQRKINFTKIFYLSKQALKGKKAYVNATKL